jgi:hypothetical protein
MAMVTYLGVDPVSEIHDSGDLMPAKHIAVGGEHKHLLSEEVVLDRGQVVAAVLAPLIFLPIHQLAQPVEALGISRTGGGHGGDGVSKSGGGRASPHFSAKVPADLPAQGLARRQRTELRRQAGRGGWPSIHTIK